MRRIISELVTALVLSTLTCHVGATMSFDRNEWMQVSPNIEFQQNADLSMDSSIRHRATDEAIHRMLSSSSTESSSSDTESSSGEKETNPSYLYQPRDSSVEYSEYQLAWHLLGYYIDCSYSNNGRSLKDDKDKEGEGQAGCKRLVLYAVYANPTYSGGGLSSYSFYDKSTDEWHCYGGSCTMKMDCHLPETEWKLLGVFKIDSISDNNGWMEQLFKHQGVCIWGEDTYGFASTMRQKMPDKCKSSKQQLEDGSYLYYDIKPEIDGDITLGLYTDNMCSKDYTGNVTYDVFQLAGQYESYWTKFNEALDVYKQCQPCIAYDVSQNNFECYDQAGYTNCNQCMKFSNKAGCKTATTSDVMLAARQRSLISFEANGITYGVGGIGRSDFDAYSTWEANERAIGISSTTSAESSTYQFPYLTTSILCFLFGLTAFVHATIFPSIQNNDKSEDDLGDSLISSDPSNKSRKSFMSLTSIKATASRFLDKISASFLGNESLKEKEEAILEPTVDVVLEPPHSLKENIVEDVLAESSPPQPDTSEEMTAHNVCMAYGMGIHTHLNTLDREDEGSGVTHDTCMIVGEGVHNFGEGFYSTLCNPK